MKIKLEYPYSADWKSGYLQTNGDGRKTVILFNSEQDRSSTAYARYVMAVKLKRYLTSDEEVDHIDCNKFDDSLENLQLLTKEEHREKTTAERAVPPLKFICECCGKDFERVKNKATSKTKYCSVGCRNNHSKIPNPYKPYSSISPVIDVLTPKLDELKNLVVEGKNDIAIGNIFGVSSMTEYNFRKLHGILGPRQLNNVKLEQCKETILRMYNAGCGARKIGSAVNLSRKVIERFLKTVDPTIQK